MTTIQELIENGEARGKAEGKAVAIRRILERRFGPLATTVQKQLTLADTTTLDRWLDAVLDVGSADELVGR